MAFREKHCQGHLEGGEIAEVHLPGRLAEVSQEPGLVRDWHLRRQC